MQQYAKAAKELLDNVAKLTIRQETGPTKAAPPVLLQTSSSPAQCSSRALWATVPIEARISRFKQELLSSRINLEELRRLAFQGIPDKDGLRAMTWKVCNHPAWLQQPVFLQAPANMPWLTNDEREKVYRWNWPVMKQCSVVIDV